MLRRIFYCSNSLTTKSSRQAGSALATAIGVLILANVALFPAMLHHSNPSTTANRKVAAREQSINERIRQSFSRLPLSFEANLGQFDAEVKFVSRAGGYNLFLTPTEAVMEMSGQESDSGSQNKTTDHRPLTTDHCLLTAAIVRMKLEGANPDSEISGEAELAGKVNYFTGNDPARWRADVPTYAKVRYKEVYPGIDLMYYGNQRELEYDFILQPFARPQDIKLDFEGAKRLEIDKEGNLVLQTEAGEIRQRAPFIYQIIDGERQQISGRYIIEQESRVSFDVGEYDRNNRLVIDPVLAYSTYMGGSDEDALSDVAVDSEGNIYATGYTESTDFPARRPLQPTLNGASDAFVMKLNPSGTALEYCTYLGGSGEEIGNSMAVDSDGNACVTGTTLSADFPVVNALQPSYGGGRFGGDAFAAKLNPSGRSLVYATYLGGNDDDYGLAIASDSSGNAYVTGDTRSMNFPLANPLQATRRGFNDAFVARINSTGSAFVYSTLLGGNNGDFGSGIVADSQGNAYVTGSTSSTNFPVISAAQRAFGGDQDAFVTRINPAGSDLGYSTYLGGSGNENGQDIAIRDRGGAFDAYVVGNTSSTNFPIVGAIQGALSGTRDAFITHLNNLGDTLFSSTYLGGSGTEDALGVAVDSFGLVYVTGATSSTDFPAASPIPTRGAGLETFVAEVSLTNRVIYCIYLGGGGTDGGFGIAVDSRGVAYVAGLTLSNNFPTVEPFQSSFGGGATFGDGFLARIEPDPLILGVSIEGKKLIVSGQGFDDGADLFMNGEKQKKTNNDTESPSTKLIARKSGKKIMPGQTVMLVVENPDGARSPARFFTRPAQ
jgi:hypothetical protein